MGSVAAALLWWLGSVDFSLCVNSFGNFNKIYGALAGVLVLLLWLYLTCYIIVLRGEINAESERQTACDTPVREPKPRGQRGCWSPTRCRDHRRYRIRHPGQAPPSPSQARGCRRSGTP